MHTDAYDALVNLKKYIREYGGEPIGRVACVRLIDEFMEKAVLAPPPRCFEDVGEYDRLIKRLQSWGDASRYWDAMRSTRKYFDETTKMVPLNYCPNCKSVHS